MQTKLKAIAVSFIFGALISSCAPTPSGTSLQSDDVTRISFTGYYNDISGKLSDGTIFTGKGWFPPGQRNGKFCILAADLACSGKFAASTDKTISGSLNCSGGITGEYQTERVAAGAFVKPVFAHGELSDGRTAVARFSPVYQGTATVTCPKQ